MTDTNGTLELDRSALARCIDACTKLVDDLDGLMVRARNELAPADMGLGEQHLPSAAALADTMREKASAAVRVIEANRDRALEMRSDFEKTLAVYDEQERSAAEGVAAVNIRIG